MPLLVTPTKDGWAVIQVGDGGASIRSDPPTAHVAPITGATDVEVRIDTTDGVRIVNLQADQLDEGTALNSDSVRSIIAIYRDSSGAVLAVNGRHFG